MERRCLTPQDSLCYGVGLLERLTYNRKETRTMKQIAWNVYSNGKHIDTVFYDKGLDGDYVRDSLINHDGYPPDTFVVMVVHLVKATN